MTEKIAEGVWLLGRYSPFQVGVFLLEHQGEGALLEMPPYQNQMPKPWEDAKNFAKEEGIEIKYLLVSHAHIDHTFGHPYFRAAFPRAKTLVHRSFLDWYRSSIFDEIFRGPFKELNLKGEQLFLLHAPKHSPQDTLIFFRGALCSGDWSLGCHPDCNPLVSPMQKEESLKRVRDFLIDRSYWVHTVFSAHANEFRHPPDFLALIDEMYSFWKNVPMHEWRRSREQWQANFAISQKNANRKH